ncbi:MAG: tRNA (adenosine(37)-N6)-dimethylallyltransferase MiaA [Bacilli bacterium]
MVIVILGPTAVGKTKLSIELSQKLNGEIINADSTQIYQGLDIATAKIKKCDQENIPHHLFDIKNINESYTVYDYQKDCRNMIQVITKKNKTPIITGGTGLYIKAALYDYQFNDVDETTDYVNYSNQQLYQTLLTVDKKTLIHPNNRKRLIRSLDYYKANNEPLSSKEKTDKLLYDTIFIGLTTNRDTLYERINKRVDKMVNDGLIKEAKGIYDLNIQSKAVMSPIGYKELFPYFEHKDSIDNCLNKIKQNSRRYAKRQYTFFNHQLPVKWFNVDFIDFDNTVCEVFKYINEKKNVKLL